jgi:excisionase family DNA binding protein
VKQTEQSHEIMTVPELARFLRCHISTVYRMVRLGRLPFFRIGSDLRFARRSVLAWIEETGAHGLPR